MCCGECQIYAPNYLSGKLIFSLIFHTYFSSGPDYDMDTSTIVFIATIAVAFIFLRWLISPIPQLEFSLNERTTTSTRRQVSESMIEVVKTIAPGLTREQIVFDLEKTGLVELTIENYMTSNSLPFPPGYSASSGADARDVGGLRNRADGESTVGGGQVGGDARANVATGGVNLIRKFGIGEDLTVNADTELLAKKQEMVINARKRLEKSLNE